jgi:hypothetical protein
MERLSFLNRPNHGPNLKQRTAESLIQQQRRCLTHEYGGGVGSLPDAAPWLAFFRVGADTCKDHPRKKCPGRFPTSEPTWFTEPRTHPFRITRTGNRQAPHDVAGDCGICHAVSGGLNNTSESHPAGTGGAYCLLGQPGRLHRHGVVPVRLCDGFVVRRLGSATTKRSGDSHEIEPVILVGY